MIAGNAIHVLRGEGNTAENVSTPHDDTYFDTLPGYVGDFFCEVPDAIRVDTEGLRSGHGLAA
jgi:hypothetical protein